MDQDSPSHRYYRAMHGRWHADYAMVPTDPAALRDAPMSAFDRLQATHMRKPFKPRVQHASSKD